MFFWTIDNVLNYCEARIAELVFNLGYIIETDDFGA